jgi:hypothetical protein
MILAQHPNPRIEVMAEAAHRAWHANLNAKPWSETSHMVKFKFYRMVEEMLAAALNDREAA